MHVHLHVHSPARHADVHNSSVCHVRRNTGTLSESFMYAKKQTRCCGMHDAQKARRPMAAHCARGSWGGAGDVTGGWEWWICVSRVYARM